MVLLPLNWSVLEPFWLPSSESGFAALVWLCFGLPWAVINISCVEMVGISSGVGVLHFCHLGRTNSYFSLLPCLTSLSDAARACLAMKCISNGRCQSAHSSALAHHLLDSLRQVSYCHSHRRRFRQIKRASQQLLINSKKRAIRA